MKSSVLELDEAQHKTKSKSVISQGEILFLAGAVISFFFSIWLWFNGQREEGLFVGIWVPSVIGLGIFFQNLRWRHEGKSL